MGQAKRRGTLEQRVQQSRERQEREAAERFDRYEKREAQRIMITGAGMGHAGSRTVVRHSLIAATLAALTIGGPIP